MSINGKVFGIGLGWGLELCGVGVGVVGKVLDDAVYDVRRCYWLDRRVDSLFIHSINYLIAEIQSNPNTYNKTQPIHINKNHSSLSINHPNLLVSSFSSCP